jgi:hypothetical protein
VLPASLKRQPGDLIVLLVFVLSVAITLLMARIANLAGLKFLFILPGRSLSPREQLLTAKS